MGLSGFSKAKVKVEKLSAPEILSMQSGIEGNRDEDDGETTATTTDNTEDTEEDEMLDSGGAEEEKDEHGRGRGQSLHGRRSWGGARVRGRGLRGFRPGDRESGVGGVMVRGGRGRGRRRAGRHRGGDGMRSRGGRGGKRIPEPEEDHTQVAADAVAMGVPTSTPKKPIIVIGRGGKKVIVQERVHVEKLPQEEVGLTEEDHMNVQSPTTPSKTTHVLQHSVEKTNEGQDSTSHTSPAGSPSSSSASSKTAVTNDALIAASRKHYPKRENRKPPAHLADAFGPALFSTPDVMRRVSDSSHGEPGMVIENHEGEDEFRLILSEEEDVKSRIAPMEISSKSKEIFKEDDSKVIKSEKMEVSTPKVEEVSSGGRGGGRRRRTAAAVKRLAKKEEMEEAMASEEEEEDEEEDDDDASVNSEDDPNRLWCVCKKPHNNRFMICCDVCEDWFHGKCVGVTKAMGRQMEEKGQEWNCPNCTVKQQKEKERRSLNTADEDWDPGKKKGANAAANAAATAANTGTNSGRRRKSAAAAPQKAPSPPPPPVVPVVEKKKAQPQLQRKVETVPVETETVKETENGSLHEKKKIMYCIVCKKEARPTSIYCSDPCIQIHSQHLRSLMSKEKQSGATAPAVGQSKVASVTTAVKDIPKVRESSPSVQTTKVNQEPPSPELVSPEGQKAANPALTAKVAKGDARVIVYERKTGRLITGTNAPTVSNLKSWLKDHPTFEVVRPGVLPAKFY
ncbi:hypothetical protein J437_LFUL008534, partial [Ladona fulva]